MGKRATTTTATTVIEARGLTKRFRVRRPGWRRGQAETITAVRGIDLAVARGEIFAFLGPNGAGKTSTQRMLTTLLPIDAGSARIAGYDVATRAAQVRRRIGFVSQLGGADLPATGRENLLLSGQLYGLSRRETASRIEQVARLFDIEELQDRIVRTWSGGQRRRLEIALGILHEPEVLFLDEPTTGLDPQNRARLWEHIQALRAGGMTVFLTTHYLDEADALADRVAIIDQGDIRVVGTPEELKAQVSEAEISARLRRETQTRATLDDVFLKMTGRRLRDTGGTDSPAATDTTTVPNTKGTPA